MPKISFNISDSKHVKQPLIMLYLTFLEIFEIWIFQIWVSCHNKEFTSFQIRTNQFCTNETNETLQ